MLSLPAEEHSFANCAMQTRSKRRQKPDQPGPVPKVSFGKNRQPEDRKVGSEEMKIISARSRANITLAMIGLIVIIVTLIWIFWQGACLGGKVC